MTSATYPNLFWLAAVAALLLALSSERATFVSATAAAAVTNPTVECISPWTLFANCTEHNPFLLGMCNAAEVHRHTSAVLVSSGVIPLWLQGTLYRNVPAQYSFGNDQVRHWFDGLSMIYSLELDATENRVVSQSKFANTSSYRTVEAQQAYGFTGFGTYPHPGPLLPEYHPNGTCSVSATSVSRDSVLRNVTPDAELGLGFITNNDVSILSLANRYFAVTDDATWVEFDGTTLEVLADPFPFDDNLTGIPGGTSVTHGAYDATTGEYYNFVMDGTETMLGGPAKAHVFCLNTTELLISPNATWSRTVVGTVVTANNTYAHSIGLTEHYVVWLEQAQIVLSEVDMALGLTTVMDALSSLDAASHPSVFRLVHRRTGQQYAAAVSYAEAGEPPTPFGCVFHTGNVFEDVDGSIVYDTVMYEDCEYYRKLETSALLTDPASMAAGGTFTRCRIFAGFSRGALCAPVLQGPTAPGTATATPVAASFPWYNKQFHGKPYRYAYLTTLVDAATLGTSDVSGSIRKVDVTTNTTVGLAGLPGLVLTEAVFVPANLSAPAIPETEEDGALVAVAFNVSSSTSAIFAVNASTLELMFVAQLPFGIPLHFHGIFCGPAPPLPPVVDEFWGSQRLASRFCLWN